MKAPVPPQAERRGRRLLLKLSGEALAAEGEFGINGSVLKTLADNVAEVAASGIQLALVVGGGNIWRYRDGDKSVLERTTSDQMGMLAGVMNAIAFQSALEQSGVHARVQTAISMPEVAEPYIRRRAIRHLEKGRVVLFAAGIGQPYFTHDTAAALRSLEIGAEVLLKGSKVDGVYDSDPNANPTARRYERISYTDVLTKQLDIMDATAISLCRENELPIVVFDVFRAGALAAAAAGQRVGTRIGLGEPTATTAGSATASAKGNA